MQLLNKENIDKNQVNTIEQFKVLDYLKKSLTQMKLAFIY